MARPFAARFYNSKQWKRVRNAYMAHPARTPGGRIVPPGMCERCFAAGMLKPAEIVHHKVHLTPENIADTAVTMGFQNLERVCRDCHAELHGEVPSYKPRVAFSQDGKVVELYDHVD